MNRSLIKFLFSASVIMPLFLLIESCREEKSQERAWSVYKGDALSSSSADLDQIDTKNVSKLALAWTFIPNDSRGTRVGNSECNPIVIDGIMYATSARHRLYAIDAKTGKGVWSFDPFNGGEGGGINRGVTYWERGDDKRILYTARDKLFAQDAITGKLVKTFGNDGWVSMNVGLRGDSSAIAVIPTSPGIVYKDLLIIGAEVSELYGAEPGYIRAYDIPTGKLVWTFHTIPHPGEFGYDTWPKDAWKYVGGANDWAGMSLDKNRGMVFLALGSPSYDFYGADRHGSNLFGNSIVALDAATGSYKWHFQTVHHDLWDYDLPAPPNLVTVKHDGKVVDALAQTTKTGFLFLLDRETGKPLFPVEERNVPQTNVPGEKSWPTQPFPLKPLPYARQTMREEDLTNFSPAAHDSLLSRFRSLRNEGMFTPPDTRGTLMIPGTRGGSNWGGAAVDPSTGVLYVKSNDSPEIDILQRVEPTEDALPENAFYQGKSLYLSYCATCHGRDRRGDPPNYPSLQDISNRMNKATATKKIMEGSGRMPAFGGMLSGKQDAIIAFLFDQPTKRASQKEADIFEIHSNRKSTEIQRNDSTTVYLNITPFSHFRDIDGHPAIKPPWGALNAIDLNTGEYLWKVVIGNHPDLQKPGESQTGTEGYGGPIVTSGGLVFIGGTHDKKFRAYSKSTGELLWETELPGVANATPCTYWRDGRQFVAISVSGTEAQPSGSIVSFALPQSDIDQY
ncbi:MAG: pyrroloquinoline quinone-dependent dehydrogenase [Chryseolinea sp.]